MPAREGPRRDQPDQRVEHAEKDKLRRDGEEILPSLPQRQPQIRGADTAESPLPAIRRRPSPNSAVPVPRRPARVTAAARWESFQAWAPPKENPSRAELRGLDVLAMAGMEVVAHRPGADQVKEVWGQAGERYRAGYGG